MLIDPLSFFAVKPVLRVLYSLIFVRKCNLLFILFFFLLIQQFITWDAMTVCGNYNVATYIEKK